MVTAKHFYRLALLLLALAGTQPARAQSGLNDLFRAVSGALGTQKEAPPAQGVTTTMGVRGIDDGTTVAQGPVSADYQLLDGWAATPSQAAAAAAKRKLSARNVTLRADSGMTQGAQP